MYNRKLLTQDGHHLIILDDLQGSWHHETEAVNTLPGMVDEVARGTEESLELHGQGTQAPVTGQPECRVFFEDFPVEVDADICPHVLRAYLQYLGQGEQRDKS